MRFSNYFFKFDLIVSVKQFLFLAFKSLTNSNEHCIFNAAIRRGSGRGDNLFFCRRVYIAIIQPRFQRTANSQTPMHGRKGPGSKLKPPAHALKSGDNTTVP